MSDFSFSLPISLLFEISDFWKCIPQKRFLHKCNGNFSFGRKSIFSNPSKMRHPVYTKWDQRIINLMKIQNILPGFTVFDTTLYSFKWFLLLWKLKEYYTVKIRPLTSFSIDLLANAGKTNFKNTSSY